MEDDILLALAGGMTEDEVVQAMAEDMKDDLPATVTQMWHYDPGQPRVGGKWVSRGADGVMGHAARAGHAKMAEAGHLAKRDFHRAAGKVHGDLATLNAVASRQSVKMSKDEKHLAKADEHLANADLFKERAMGHAVASDGHNAAASHYDALAKDARNAGGSAGRAAKSDVAKIKGDATSRIDSAKAGLSDKVGNLKSGALSKLDAASNKASLENARAGIHNGLARVYRADAAKSHDMANRLDAAGHHEMANTIRENALHSDAKAQEHAAAALSHEGGGMGAIGSGLKERVGILKDAAAERGSRVGRAMHDGMSRASAAVERNGPTRAGLHLAAADYHDHMANVHRTMANEHKGEYNNSIFKESKQMHLDLKSGHLAAAQHHDAMAAQHREAVSGMTGTRQTASDRILGRSATGIGHAGARSQDIVDRANFKTQGARESRGYSKLVSGGAGDVSRQEWTAMMQNNPRMVVAGAMSNGAGREAAVHQVIRSALRP